MQAIFISYRRDDCPYAAHLVYARLVADFGVQRVFMDIDDIPLGEDFRTHIAKTVEGCSIALAIIGDFWYGTRQGLLPRIHNPRDFVRIEIEAALRRQIPVIPVLVAGARLPSEDGLPESLRELVYRNAAEVRAGRDCSNQLAALSRGIEKHLSKLAVLESEQEARPASSALRVAPGALVSISDPRLIMSTPGDALTPDALQAAGIAEATLRNSIVEFSHEDQWPAGIKSTTARWANQDKNLLAMRNYRAYKIADIGPKRYALLSVPAAENRHMPADMRLDTDFYVLVHKEAVAALGHS